MSNANSLASLGKTIVFDIPNPSVFTDVVIPVSTEAIFIIDWLAFTFVTSGTAGDRQICLTPTSDGKLGPDIYAPFLQEENQTMRYSFILDADTPVESFPPSSSTKPITIRLPIIKLDGSLAGDNHLASNIVNLKTGDQINAITMQVTQWIK